MFLLDCGHSNDTIQYHEPVQNRFRLVRNLQIDVGIISQFEMKPQYIIPSVQVWYVIIICVFVGKNYFSIISIIFHLRIGLEHEKTLDCRSLVVVPICLESFGLNGFVIRKLQFYNVHRLMSQPFPCTSTWIFRWFTRHNDFHKVFLQFVAMINVWFRKSLVRF